jgi:transposase-like protein
MSRCRYPAARKVEAVRRVVENGHSVSSVARDLCVSEGSLFFWVRRYRQFARQSRVPLEVDPEPGFSPGSLVAYLRRVGRKGKPPNPAKKCATS